MKIKKIKSNYSNLGLDKISKDLVLNIDEHYDEKGDFDYDSYVKAQTRLNVQKINLNFEGPNITRIKKISKYIKKNIPNLNFGLCHGTRTGSEQQDFKKFLKVDVLGTEISHTATEFPDTIRWDFHEIKDEWINNVCFIFSNSLDHSYDPIYCLSQWMKCIKPAGKIFLQKSKDDYPDHINAYPEADMFQSSDEAFLKIIDASGAGEWIYKSPKELIENSRKRVIVLERK